MQPHAASLPIARMTEGRQDDHKTGTCSWSGYVPPQPPQALSLHAGQIVSQLVVGVAVKAPVQGQGAHDVLNSKRSTEGCQLRPEPAVRVAVMRVWYKY